MQGISFEFGLGKSRPSRGNQAGGALKIVVMGDFSGRNVVAGEIRERKLLQVEVDTLDRVMQRLRPEIELQRFAGSGEAGLTFASLDDFHPDAIFPHFAPLAALRDLRARLADPATFADAALALKNMLPDGQSPASETSPADSSSGLFDQLMQQPRAAKPAGSVVDRLIANIVMPHLGESVDLERQAALIRALDEAIGDTLRQVLHAPEFQALESRWRSLHWLLNRIVHEEAVKVYLLDAGRAELVQEMPTAGGAADATRFALNLLHQADLRSSGCLLVGAYRFAADEESIAVLKYLGDLANRLGGVFFADADPCLTGLRSEDNPEDPAIFRQSPKPPQAWQTFRHEPMAGRVALAWPRFILRQPYGKRSDPIDSFQFEEIPGTPSRQHYLWGGGGFLCAGLIAAAFGDEYVPPEVAHEADDFPCHVYASDNGRVMRPATEFLIGEAAVESSLQAGVIPLLGAARWNGVRIPRLQTTAASPTDPVGLLL